MKKKPARYFQDLIGWQKAHRSALSIYRFKEVSKLPEAYTASILASDS